MRALYPFIRPFIFVILLSFGLGISSFGQVTITESFDGANFLPGGWSSVGTTNLWSRRTSGTFPTCTNHSGAGMARFSARGAAAKTTQTIATPNVDYSNRGTNTPKVSFWIYRDNGSTLADSLSVYVNTGLSLNSATWLGTVSRYSKIMTPDTVASNGWYQYTFSIPSGFKSGNNYILFKAIGEGGYNIYIDDVQWDDYPNLCTGTPNPGSINALPNVICGGGGSSVLTLSGQTSGYSGLTYQWKVATSAGGPFSNIGTSATTYSTGNLTATRYYKCIVGCSYSSKIDSTTIKEIKVTSNPNPVITFTPNVVNYCQNGPAVGIQANGANVVKWTWSPATALNRTDTSYVLSLPTATLGYTVIGVDTAGCTGSGNILVNFRTAPTVSITKTDSMLCVGDSIRLIATGGGGPGNTYVWEPNGETTAAIFAKPLTSDFFKVTLRNNVGCTAKASTFLYVKQKPKAYFGFKQNGNKINFYDSSLQTSNYEWEFGDGNGSKAPNPVYVFPEFGTYKVSLIAHNEPCLSDTFSRIIKVSSASVSQIEASDVPLIFPNPTQNLLSIRSEHPYTVTLMNALGQTVLAASSIENTLKMETGHLKSGVYTVQVKHDGKIHRYTLLKTED